ncbi:MAG TPA: biotin/lipoyl-containing protein [Thermoanaerobaculia bacterium]|jgi:biotin carboxyl carrier protein
MRRLKLVHRGKHGPEELSVELSGDRCVLSRGDSTEIAEATLLPDGRLSLRFEDGRQVCGRVLPAGAGEVEVLTGRGSRRLSLAEPLRDRLMHSAHAADGEVADEEVRALIPGRVVYVNVSVGDEVAAGELLLVLEAMKMQNEIRTERGGTVTAVHVESGKPVEGGTLLAVVRSGEPSEAGASTPG